MSKLLDWDTSWLALHAAYMFGYKEGNMRKALFVGMLVAMLVLPSGVLANGGAVTTTDPYSFENCFNDTGPGLGSCHIDRGVWHQTVTPSGNTIFQQNNHYILVRYFDGVEVGTTSGDYHYVAVMKNGDIHVDSGRQSVVFTYGGTTCTYDAVFHFADGKLRRHYYNYVCS